MLIATPSIETFRLCPLTIAIIVYRACQISEQCPLVFINESGSFCFFQNGLEVRLPCDKGIAGYVARTGEMLNIRDAQSHPLFYRNIDQVTGFKTR